MNAPKNFKITSNSLMTAAFRVIGEQDTFMVKQGILYKLYTGYKVYETSLSTSPYVAADGDVIEV